MPISHELGNKLAVQFEKMRIIEAHEIPNFWLEVVRWNIRDASRTVFDSFVDYITKVLPFLDKVEQEQEEPLLKELLAMFEDILQDLNSEKKLSSSDQKFRNAIRGMQRLLISFMLGRYGWENPAAYINQSYEAGQQYQLNSQEQTN